MPELYRLADYTHVNTQADAKHSGQEWEKIDVPTKRHELLAYLNDIANNVRGGSPQVSPPTADMQEPAEEAVTQPPAPAPAPPSPPPDDDLPDEDADLFDAKTLEQQVDALGMLGVEALERFDGWTAITGISATFARGVALLNILCADDHAVAKMFLRDRLKKRRKFGNG